EKRRHRVAEKSYCRHSVGVRCRQLSRRIGAIGGAEKGGKSPIARIPRSRDQENDINHRRDSKINADRKSTEEIVGSGLLRTPIKLAVSHGVRTASRGARWAALGRSPTCRS